jgi:predicted DNA binding CopG/RHH family protein
MENKIEVPEVDYDTVGEDEQFVAPAKEHQDKSIDDALGLQPISIRLQKDLVENLKALAQLNGLGYQPLIRQILTRWVDCELKHVLRERVASERDAISQRHESQAQAQIPTDNRLAA